MLYRCANSLCMNNTNCNESSSHELSLNSGADSVQPSSTSPESGQEVLKPGYTLTSLGGTGKAYQYSGSSPPIKWDLGGEAQASILSIHPEEAGGREVR